LPIRIISNKGSNCFNAREKPGLTPVMVLIAVAPVTHDVINFRQQASASWSPIARESEHWIIAGVTVSPHIFGYGSLPEVSPRRKARQAKRDRQELMGHIFSEVWRKKQAGNSMQKSEPHEAPTGWDHRKAKLRYWQQYHSIPEALLNVPFSVREIGLIGRNLRKSETEIDKGQSIKPAGSYSTE